MSTIDVVTTPWSELTQHGQDPSIVLAASCQLAAVAVLGWLALALCAYAIGTVPGRLGRGARRCARAITPVLAQRAGVAIIGLVTAAGPGPAWASDGTALPAPGQPAVQAPATGAVPDLTPTTTARPASTVVVKPGDTLWDLTRAELGPAATDPVIAESWPRWWHDNRGIIGPDPDLLRPGQVLHVPEGSR